MTHRTGPVAALLSLLLALTWSVTSMAQDVELLDVTDAFALRAKVTKPGELALHFDIAPEYYLYRGRIKISSNDPAVNLGVAQLPAGKRKNDQFLGEVEVYHGMVDAVVPFTLSDPTADSLQVAVQFQGCHETDPKICYPPHTQRFALALPAVDAAMPPPAMPSGGLGAALSQLGAPPAAPLAASQDLPLPPEQAFRFEAIADGSHGILARFSMAPGYYLYRDKSSVGVAQGDGVTLGPATWPKGEMHADEHFGTTEVFFNEATVSIPLARGDASETPITLKATFQGCQDGGICYPLMNRSVELVLPAASAAEMKAGAGIAAGWAETETDEANAAQSEEQEIAGSLAGDGRLLALLAFLGFGLLLAFTPCVLPMIPILSGLIAGAGKISTSRAFVLSLVYVLSTCVVFTIAGVLAGMAGANLQAVFQTPWIIWSFALLFVALAMSMFGFYELKLPNSLQAKLTRASGEQKAGSLLGVAVMGVLSALIVGPCVAPPLAGAVLYIAKTGDPVFGGLALFLLSLGMGLPLLAFGTAAGRLLPHTGAWMTRVNAVFGVVFLGLAIWMLTRILDPLWIMLLTGALLVACAVYLGALERIAEGASGWQKLWKALGLILLVLGAAELIGVAAGSRDPLQPLGSISNGSASSVEAEPLFRRIRSTAELDQALAAAQAAGKPLVLDYYADWCVACKEMERFTLSESTVRAALEGFVLVQADVTENNADDKALLERFGLFGPPATIFFVDGKELRGERLIGFEESEPFLARIGRVRSRTSGP